jgi:hypothetical protein
MCPFMVKLMHDYTISCRSDQLSDPKDSVADEIEKCVESDHCSSGNDPDAVDKKQPSDSTLTRVRCTLIILTYASH